MALTRKEIESIIKKIVPFGTVIDYLVEQVPSSDFSLSGVLSILLVEDKETRLKKLTLIQGQLNNYDKKEIKKSYKPRFTKKRSIQLLLDRHLDQCKHLQAIKDVALTDELANQLVENKEYSRAMDLYYLQKVLSYFEKHYPNDFLELENECYVIQDVLANIQEVNDQKMLHSINKYYIRTITE